MKGSFTNLYDQDLTKLLGNALSYRCPRTPDTDNNDINNNARLDMSAVGLKNLEKGEHGRNVNWTTDINQELPIKIGSHGISRNLKPETISKVFLRAAM